MITKAMNPQLKAVNQDQIEPGQSLGSRRVQCWEVCGQDDYFDLNTAQRYDCVSVTYTDGDQEDMLLLRY